MISSVISQILAFDFSKFEFEHFIHAIEQLHGRQILFIPWEMPPNLYGAWISNTAAPIEFIFFNTRISPILQTHTKLHEIGHLVHNHPTLRVSPEKLKEMLQEENLQTFQNALKRSRENEGKEVLEREAENFARGIVANVITQASLDHLHRPLSKKLTHEFLKELGLV